MSIKVRNLPQVKTLSDAVELIVESASGTGKCTFADLRQQLLAAGMNIPDEWINQVAKAVYEKKGVGILPHVTVTTLAGSTVTLKNGDITLTADEDTDKHTWSFDIPKLGEWTVHAEKEGVFARDVVVNVQTIAEYPVHVSHGVRYGFRTREGEADPYGRVEYLYDAVGLKPAKMDFTTGKFDFGDWGDKWFVTGNRPCMVKPDGTIDCYLDPDNYALKEDGTTSAVSDTGQDCNAMATFPLCYVKRYEDDNWKYIIISDIPYDETYKAYAHTRADGSIADYFFWSMFGGSGNASKIRSLADQSLSNSLTAEQEIAGCRANGSGWYTHVWAQRQLIQDLCVLMTKSTNFQAAFGNGNNRSGDSASYLLKTGTLKDKGQFWGANADYAHQVKVFHLEKFFGDQWDRTAGIIVSGGQVWAKMTPEGQGYRVNDLIGYTNTGISITGTSGGYISKETCSEFGMIPNTVAGSATTHYCDGCWFKAGPTYLAAGGSANEAACAAGGFAFNADHSPAYANWHFGCGLSLLQPAEA